MANTIHLDKLSKGRRVWNQWRSDNPNIIPDLAKAHLVGKSLSGFNLQGAQLSKAHLDRAHLHHTNFIGTFLGGASLKDAKCKSMDCRGAMLGGAVLNRADLTDANLRTAKASSSNFTGCLLLRCDLTRAELKGSTFESSNLTHATVVGADLSTARFDQAELSFADFTQAIFRRASLRNIVAKNANFNLAVFHLAVLDGANITNARLWETQRAGWSIKGINCERAFWDEEAKTASNFAVGEFERLFGNQPVIELFYSEGITAFELNTFPALLHELSKMNPDCKLRLASMTETNGGALITIKIEEADDSALSLLRIYAETLREAQVALRESFRQNDRLRIEKSLLLDEVFPRILSKTTNTVQVLGPATTVAIAFDNATVETVFENSFDASALSTLLGEIRASIADLPRQNQSSIELNDTIQRLEDDLARKNTSPGFLSNLLKNLQEQLVKISLNEATSILSEHLPSILKQLEHLIKK